MTHIEDTELRDKIVKLMHPVSFKVIYPETQMEENYPIANSIVDLIQQERLKEKLYQLEWAEKNCLRAGFIEDVIKLKQYYEAELESLLNKEQQ